jgi:4-hydroxy-3-polyprenylbenzoate decarboxylase
METSRVIVGISGASGVRYGIRLLEVLRDLGFESHLVITKAAEMTLAYETDLSTQDVAALAYKRYAAGDMGAAISSGSFATRGMIVAPCSVRSMAEIATGVTTQLLTRAADVALKDRRPLVLMVRETPLHLGHLRNMTQLAEMGAILAPPMPAFYRRPQSADEIIDQSVGRALDLLGIDAPVTRRWGEDIGPAAPSDPSDKPA